MTTLKSRIKLQNISKRFSDTSLTKKASLNAFAAALDYGARLIVGFLLNPLLLAGLGSYLYGVWQILGRLIDYISAASGRPTQTLKMTIASQQASADFDQKRRNVGSALIVWALFAPLLAAIGAVLAWFAPAWLGAPAQYTWIVRLTAGLLVADLIATNLVDVPESVLRGENMGYKRMGMTTLLVFVQGAVIALALALGTGIVGVAVATLIDTLLTGLLFLAIVRSYVPWFGSARPSRGEVRVFFGLSAWFLIWRLVIQLITASDVVVLGLLSSVEQVTSYTLTKYTPEALISLVAIVVGGVAPGLGGMLGAGNLHKAARVRGEIMAGTWLLATGAGVTILLWNRSFVQLWVGHEYYVGVVPSLMIMLMMIQFVLIRNDANIIDLTLNLRSKVLLGMLSAAISLAGAGLLVRYFGLGITGLCLGLMLGRTVLSLGYPLIIGRHLGLAPAGQLASAVRPGLAMALLFAAALALQPMLATDSWLVLVAATGTTMLATSLLAFYGGLTAGQRAGIVRRVRAAIGSSTEG